MCELFVERECQDSTSCLEWEFVEAVIVDSDSNFQIRNLCLEWEERNSMRKKQRNVNSRLSYTANKIEQMVWGGVLC